MDEISTKAISIGVAVFITIAITSGVFYVINEMRNIYSEVYETDISIQSMFSEFEQYDNTQKSGIEVLNTIKKYINNSLVEVYVGTERIVATSTFYTDYTSKIGQEEYESFLSLKGEERYNSKVLLDESTGITKIEFKKI